MDVLQQLCFMVSEQIKGAFSFSMSGMKNDSILLVLCRRIVRVFYLMDNLGFPWRYYKSEQIYHANSRNQPCVWNLYKCTFGATNQFANCIICTKCTLHHG